jgi:hypothetical protein
VLKATRTPVGAALLENERDVLAGLLDAAGGTTYRKYLPELVESFAAPAEHRDRVNTFNFEPGFCTLEELHGRHTALDGRHLGWIFNRLLTVLGFCHRRGVVHGAVLPCHVLVHAAGHGLRLVGWGGAVAAGRRVGTRAARYLGWYPPEVREQRPATAATDLFLAARCMAYLAGGDPVAGVFSDAVPAPMRSFFASCLLPGQRMRPDDAWALFDEFAGVLHRLYGPPRFHPLT